MRAISPSMDYKRLSNVCSRRIKHPLKSRKMEKRVKSVAEEKSAGTTPNTVMLALNHTNCTPTSLLIMGKEAERKKQKEFAPP